MRRLLAIYMTLMLVAGPSLCCCTTLYAATLPAAGHATPSPTRPAPCCCQDNCPAKGENTSGDPQGGRSLPEHPPGDHKCPCKDKGTKQTLDQPVSSLTAQEVARLLTSTLQFVPVALTTDPVVDADLDSGGGSSPPGHRLTSWRLLQAHHLLRC